MPSLKSVWIAPEYALDIVRTRYDLHFGPGLRGEHGEVMRDDTPSLVRGKKVRDDLRPDMPCWSVDDDYLFSFNFQAGK